MTFLFTLSVLADSNRESWSRIELPKQRQSTQVEAGYRMGCEITSMLYALKFGPVEWRSAYKNIPGETDLLKIRALATKFSSIPSKFSSGQTAFSEKTGMNPNDVSWMISMLAPNSTPLKVSDYYARSDASSLEQQRILKNFHSDLSESLDKGQPIIMDLYFLNPVFSHAVLVVGVRDSIATDSTLAVEVLDPATGEISQATVRAETAYTGGSAFIGISFVDHEVAESKAIITKIHH